MANIYEITNQFPFLKNLEESGEISEEDARAALDVAKEDLAYKLEDYCKVIKNLETEISGLKAEETRLAERRRAKENAIERMKSAMEFALTVASESKMACGTFTVAVQNNPPSCVLDASIADIPAKYLIPQEPKVDKRKILEDLKASGKEVPYAHIEQSSSLRIR